MTTDKTILAILTACVLCMAAMVCFYPHDLTPNLFDVLGTIVGSIVVALLLS